MVGDADLVHFFGGVQSDDVMQNRAADQGDLATPAGAVDDVVPGRSGHSSTESAFLGQLRWGSGCRVAVTVATRSSVLCGCVARWVVAGVVRTHILPMKVPHLSALPECSVGPLISSHWCCSPRYRSSYHLVFPFISLLVSSSSGARGIALWHGVLKAVCDSGRGQLAGVVRQRRSAQGGPPVWMRKRGAERQLITLAHRPGWADSASCR